MKRTTLIAAFALGLSSVACGTNGTDTVDPAPNGLPALTAEEQAVADHMEGNTLAEIDLPEGKMKFIELEPGMVSIIREIRIGADFTRVEGENQMTLSQIFRAYAPEREVPRELIEAEARVAERDRTAAAGPDVEAGIPASGQGTRPEKPSAALPEGTERVTSALTSSINATWFVNQFCNPIGADWHWCTLGVSAGQFASWTAHESNAVLCGDTGSGALQLFIDGALRSTVGVPYGTCKYSGVYHGPHNFLGMNLKRGIKYVVAVGNTVHFAGWMAQGDNFVGHF